jgi:hypothetical protein
MLFRLFNRSHTDSLRAQVEESIRAGTGLRQSEWLLDAGARGPEDVAALAERVAEWCREQIGETRRPYGIDQLALAVACAEPGGAPIASTTFGVFRPVDFYREGGVGEQVVDFVTGLPPAALESPPTVRFAAALFSWGDVARETIYRDDRDEATE